MVDHDPGYSVDMLRKEAWERSKMRADYEKKAIYELGAIKGSLWAIAAVLVYIAWKLH